VAIIMMDGFDWKPDDNQVSPVLFPWTSVGTRIVSSRSRFAGGAAATFAGGVGIHYYLTQPQRDATVVVGFACFVSSSDICVIRTSLYTDTGTNSQITISLDYTTTRAVRILQGGGLTQIATSSSNILQLSTWQYIEAKCFLTNSTVSGYVEVRVDGVPVVTFTGKTNSNATTLLFDRVSINNATGNLGNNNVNPAIDDVYILNTSGGINTDFLGDVHIDVYVPSGAGTYTQWTGTGATVASGNWSLVDESPTPDVTDYVSTSTSGAIDTYKFKSLPDFVSKIYAVEAITYAGKTGSQVRQIAPVVVYSGILATGTYNTLPQPGYIYQDNIFNYNPVTNSGWTPSGVVESEFGFIST